jgi:hypothetical protein
MRAMLAFFLCSVNVGTIVAGQLGLSLAAVIVQRPFQLYLFFPL